MTVEGGEEAITAIWKNKELTTHLFSIKHKTVL